MTQRGCGHILAVVTAIILWPAAWNLFCVCSLLVAGPHWSHWPELDSGATGQFFSLPLDSGAAIFNFIFVHRWSAHRTMHMPTHMPMSMPTHMSKHTFAASWQRLQVHTQRPTWHTQICNAHSAARAVPDRWAPTKTLYCYGLYSHGLCSYGLYSYGPMVSDQISGPARSCRPASPFKETPARNASVTRARIGLSIAWLESALSMARASMATVS